jgi:NitT/TauT family transport system substrate-binding protein
LRIYGNLSLLEMAPVLLAADEIYPGKTLIEHGGVMSLWGEQTDLPSLAASGESDVAANSETQALRATFDHPDLRFVFTAAECPYRILARRSAGIAALADLRGKSVGTMPKSSAEFFLDRMLRTAGGRAGCTIVPFISEDQFLDAHPAKIVGWSLDPVPASGAADAANRHR